jgi:hypothetical protein
MALGDIVRETRSILPGVRLRPRLFWRYTLGIVPEQPGTFFDQPSVRGLLRVSRLAMRVLSAQFRCASLCWGRRS